MGPSVAFLLNQPHCGSRMSPSRLTARKEQGGTGLAPLAFRRASFSHSLIIQASASWAQVLLWLRRMLCFQAFFPHPEPKGAPSDSHLIDLQPLYGLGVGPVHSSGSARVTPHWAQSYCGMFPFSTPRCVRLRHLSLLPSAPVLLSELNYLVRRGQHSRGGTSGLAFC